MSKINRASVPHEDGLLEHLRSDRGFALEYLRVCLEEEDDQTALLTALRRVAMAYGVQHIAQEAGVNRESLYRSLSSRGNPTLKTLRAVLKPMGLRLSVERLDAEAHAGAPPHSPGSAPPLAP